MSNFVEVMEQNQYYVDKTMYLPILEEQPSSIFFIRPRRFGKSIFLSMMRAYYDMAQKEKFQSLFGNLWIGQHPTPLQGTYYLSISSYYLTAPEVELNHGFCDMFLMHDLKRYDGVAHSYILELKYLSAKDYDAKQEAQRQEAIEQIKGYASGKRVQQLIQGTQLHCIIMQFRGCELARMEEVTS